MKAEWHILIEYYTSVSAWDVVELEKIRNTIQREPEKIGKVKKMETDWNSGYIRYFNGRGGEISLEVHSDGALWPKSCNISPESFWWDPCLYWKRNSKWDLTGRSSGDPKSHRKRFRSSAGSSGQNTEGGCSYFLRKELVYVIHSI